MSPSKKAWNYIEATEKLKSNLEQIRQEEKRYQECIVNNKVSRAGISILNGINSLYAHRMNELVPFHARAKKEYYTMIEEKLNSIP